MFGSSFTFDGFQSSDLNLHIVSFNKDNFIEIPISSSEDNNLSFDVEIAYATKDGEALEIDNLTRRMIFSKLITDDYKELTLEDYEGIVFYAKFIPVSTNINSSNKGYFKFKIETNSKYAYSEYKEYLLENTGDEDKAIFFSSYDNLNIDLLYPIIEFEIIDDSITEMYAMSSNGEIIFDFSDLKDYELLELGEKIIVNCEDCTIEQTISKPFANRVKHWNCRFITVNNHDYITISPKTKVNIKYRIKVVV